MSKQNLEKTLYKELKTLNDVIDRKIIRGLPYGRDAQRHKFLLSSLAKLRRVSRAGSGWFARSLSLASTFLF